MKINRYNKFLKENIRSDEHSHLNDILDNRWDDSTHDAYVDEEDSTGENDNIQDLLSVLRKLFTNSGLYNVEIENNKRDLIITIELRNRENLKDIIKLFEVVSKLKKDILPQYDSEFDMWETKGGAPLLTFSFYYSDI